MLIDLWTTNIEWQGFLQKKDPKWFLHVQYYANIEW